MQNEPDAVAERYLRFALDEAPGRSDLYAAWASRVAADPDLQRLLARLPGTRRQPPLVFAVTRLLGVGEVPADDWAVWTLAHGDVVVEECLRRAVQTNEPLRCAALLPALSLIPGPLAIIEVGASAGLCLYPDRYSFRYAGPAGRVQLDPVDGPSPVVLDCDVRGERMPVVAHPDIVWRAGIDLNPLDVRDARDVDWLAGLVWPGETGRAERIRAAASIAASDPPRMYRGDAAELIAEAAAAAPSDATLVVTTPGVLAHIPRAARLGVIERARAAGRWITIDDPDLHDGWRGLDRQTWPGGFAVALDGDIVAAADPLGRWWEWHPGAAARRG